MKMVTRVSMECCLQEMWREYWRGIGAEEKLCNEEETVREFTYLGETVSAGGG